MASNVTGDVRTRNHGSYDWTLLFTVTAMLGLGLVMVFSASYPRGLKGSTIPSILLCASSPGLPSASPP